LAIEFVKDSADPAVHPRDCAVVVKPIVLHESQRKWCSGIIVCTGQQCMSA
jgi:hypothetical protein